MKSRQLKNGPFSEHLEKGFDKREVAESQGAVLH